MICKYSQLKNAAATKDQILAVSKKLNKTPEEITKLTSEVDPTKKYEVWLLKQMAFQNIRLPEDAERVQQTLQKFEQLNQHRQLQFQNINQYKTIMELEVEIKNKIPKELGENYDYRLQEYMKLPGVKLYGQNNEYLILEVSDPESLTDLGHQTAWCTKHLERAIEHIVEEGNKQYVVFKKENGKYVKFAQFAEDFSQFKDIDNEDIDEVDDSLFELATRKLEAPFSFVKSNVNAIHSWLNNNKIVEGDLNLQKSPLTNLPDGLSVKGGLYLRNSQITSLPEGLSVEGYLDLEGTHITSLPGDLSVGKSLSLSYTPITSLPEGLSVSGNLFLSGSQITSLPENLYVKGGLFLNKTRIMTLPRGLYVGWDLNLDNTQITSLPEDLYVEGRLHGINPKTNFRYQDEYNEIVRTRQHNKKSNLRKLRIKK